MFAATVAVAATVVSLLTAPATAAPTPGAAGSLSATRPNIVLLLTDDQTIESMRQMPYLQSGIDTGQYVEFTSAEVNNSICCPSRGAILSGQVDTRNGVLNNSLGRSLDTSKTMVAALQNSGYRTGFYGKMLNGYADSWGRPQGWTDFQPLLPRNIYTQYNYTISNNGVAEKHGSAPEDYAVDVLAAKARTFIDGSTPDRPFFLMVAPTATHTPFVAAPRYLGNHASATVVLPPNFSESDVSDKPAWVQQQPTVGTAGSTGAKRKQWDAALGVDDLLRTLEDELRATGQLDNTVVVFMSDNGLSQGSHRWQTKRCEYRECVSVPLVVRYPGQPGRRETRLASNTDLAPTFLELAGTAPLQVQDGASLVPVLEDPTGAVVTRDAILGHWPGGDDVGAYTANTRPTAGFYSIRVDGWRYVEVANLDVPGGIEPELYDEIADPYELVNLATDPAYAERVADLKARLASLVTASGQTPAQPQGTWRPGSFPTPGSVYIDLG